MTADEAYAKGYRMFCVECNRIYREAPTRQHEDGHGGRQMQMCRCGCDLFKAIMPSATTEAAEAKP